MKLLLTHRYFWPDSPPYAAMLRTIGEGLAKEGHEVHVFASKPSYRETVDAPSVERLGELQVRRNWVFRERRANRAVRVLNVVLYCWGLFLQILRVRPNVVTASTFPPVVAAWSASLAAKWVGAKFIYHLQDIHPELSKFSGGAMGRGPWYRLFMWLDNQTLQRASAIVVLSRDMANTLRSRGIGDLPIHVINNFLLDDFGDSDTPPAELRKRAGQRRVIFAGNLGRFQNLPLLAEGVAQCFERHPELELFLLGDGEALAGLRDRWAGHPQVRFASFLPFAQARSLIAESDVGLVSLCPDIYRVSYPSKILTYLGLGVPILALVEPESEIAREIHEGRLGDVPSGAAESDVANALIRLLQDPERGAGIPVWQESGPSVKNVVRDWTSLLDAISTTRQSKVE